MTEFERKRRALEEIKKRNNAPGNIPKMETPEEIEKERDISDLRRALESGTTDISEVSTGYEDEMMKDKESKEKLKKILERKID
jgi:hypothetical protein